MPSQKRVNQKGREVLVSAQRKASGGKKKPAGSSRGPWWERVYWPGAAQGLVLGVVIYAAGSLVLPQLVPVLRGNHPLPVAALLGAVVGGSRLRPLLWAWAGAVCALLLVVGYTSLVGPAVRSLVRSDRLQPTEAVVVLSSDIEPSGALTALAQARLLRGYELLQEGYARRLVVTRLPPPKKSYVPVVTRQMRNLGLDYLIEETEVVGNTYDEALAVKRLMAHRG
ncbi:MAG TPA: hypothetical protein VFU47_17810, partial [Armatimonadota bacterium]|nr:hypothetical protein [Armatimonadota bacterium]